MKRTTIRRLARVGALALVFTLLAVPPAAATPAAQTADGAIGFRALSGAAAASFSLPSDMRLVRELEFTAYGLTYERYQQFLGPAQVYGGQFTLYRDASGAVATVMGAHFANIRPTNAVGLSRADAEAIAHRDLAAGAAANAASGAGGPPAESDAAAQGAAAGDHRAVDLLINPATGRYFYRVEHRGLDSRWMHWIDASSGAILNRYDNIQSDHAVGVKGDTKDINGPDNASTGDDLTTYHNASGHGAKGSHWDLFSKDNRQWTYNAKNGRSGLYYVTDSDNHWTTTGRTSPGHPALIDAQFYANATDDYFKERHGFDWQTCYIRMQSVAHYGRNYNNAFWNGTYIVYGDGDGSTFREFSGGLDVVAHEHTHGVTECTSDLVYQGESGALNEAFSDILGNSAEFYASESTSSNCVRASDQVACADWWIGEDVYLPTDTVRGFRNMADPAEDDDPDHYSERYTGSDDNGGVHTNSGIPNHAYFLLVNGGKNAGEARSHSHTGPAVTGIGLADAEKIFFLAFTGLPSNASMCDARGATVAQASNLFGATSPQALSTKDAWEAVGLTAALCGS